MEKLHSDIAYLVVSTKDRMASDRVYGLSTVWVNPYQARVSTVEEVVRQLITLISGGPNRPYALVWFNGDTSHVPLPREGHLCILTEGGHLQANQSARSLPTPALRFAGHLPNRTEWV